MNTYEIKVEAKRERYAQIAQNKRQEAEQRQKVASDIVEAIPFGQPILVGHHSEKRHRKAIDTLNRNMQKSLELTQTASYYEEKAESYGTHGISSDNPEALDLLKEKLKKAEEEHQAYKNHNAKARKEKSEMLASYVLRNSLARIKAIKARINTLEKLQTMESFDYTCPDWNITQDKEDNRLILTFVHGKPHHTTIATVKSRGFKWSSYRMAWVRKVTQNALYATKRLTEELKALPSIY